MSADLAHVLATLVLAAHASFILFVALGGLAVARWPRLAWLHLPAVAWGAGISFAGAVCPLTPLENRLRVAAGADAYAGGFIDHYLLAFVYPDGLTRDARLALGFAALGVNAVAYAWLLYRRRRGRATVRQR